MIRINLLPVRELEAKDVRRQEIAIGAASLVLTVAAIVALYLFQAYRVSGLRRDADNLKKEIASLDVELKKVGVERQKVKELEEKIKVIDSLSKKKVGPVRVMESLSAAVPPRLWLTEFKESAGNLTITGLAVDNQTVADFLKALATFAYFNNVDLVETTQVEQEGVSLKKFSVRSQLLYQPPPPPEPKKGGAGAATPPSKEEKKK